MADQSQLFRGLVRQLVLSPDQQEQMRFVLANAQDRIKIVFENQVLLFQAETDQFLSEPQKVMLKSLFDNWYQRWLSSSDWNT